MIIKTFFMDCVTMVSFYMGKSLPMNLILSCSMDRTVYVSTSSKEVGPPLIRGTTFASESFQNRISGFFSSIVES